MSIILNSNLALINVESFKGAMHSISIGTAMIPNHKPINVTWDADNCKLVIHEWYDLTDEERTKLTATLTDYFKSMN